MLFFVFSFNSVAALVSPAGPSSFDICFESVAGARFEEDDGDTGC